MYRQPIDPGYGAIGAALAMGLGNAAQAMRQNRGEEEEKRRFRMEQERLDRAEALRAQELQHQREREALDDRLRGIGTREVVQQDDPITAAVNTTPATLGLAPARAVVPQAAPALGGDPILAAVRGGGAVVPRRLALPTSAPAPLGEGDLDLGGGRVFRPTRSADFVTRRAEAGATQQQEAGLRAQAAARIRAANPNLTPQQAEVMASGIKLDDLMTPGEQEDRAARMLLRELQIKQPFELAQRAASRAGAGGGGGRRSGGVEGEGEVDTTRLTLPQQRQAAVAEIQNGVANWAGGFISGENRAPAPFSPADLAALRARYPRVPPAQLDQAVRMAWDRTMGEFFDDMGFPKAGGDTNVTYDRAGRVLHTAEEGRRVPASVARARAGGTASRPRAVAGGDTADSGLAQARRDYDALVARLGADTVRARLGPRP